MLQTFVCFVCPRTAGPTPKIQVVVSNPASSTTSAGLWVVQALAQIWWQVLPLDATFAGDFKGAFTLNCSKDMTHQLPWDPLFTGSWMSWVTDVAAEYNLLPGSSLTCVSTNESFNKLRWLPPGQIKFSTWVGRHTRQNTEMLEVTIPVPHTPALTVHVEASRCLPSSTAGLDFFCPDGLQIENSGNTPLSLAALSAGALLYDGSQCWHDKVPPHETVFCDFAWSLSQAELEQGQSLVQLAVQGNDTAGPAFLQHTGSAMLLVGQVAVSLTAGLSVNVSATQWLDGQSMHPLCCGLSSAVSYQGMPYAQGPSMVDSNGAGGMYPTSPSCSCYNFRYDDYNGQWRRPYVRSSTFVPGKCLRSSTCVPGPYLMRLQTYVWVLYSLQAIVRFRFSAS